MPIIVFLFAIYLILIFTYNIQKIAHDCSKTCFTDNKKFNIFHYIMTK